MCSGSAGGMGEVVLWADSTDEQLLMIRFVLSSGVSIDRSASKQEEAEAAGAKLCR